ncbi:MAG: LiaI-LiaF-like domain-containing protein [Bacillota bacterium]
MIKRKVGTITLAAGLIAAGGLWLAQNFTDIAMKEVLKYWPILLIGLGIEMIVYMVIQNADNGNTKIGVDGLAIAFIIIVAVISSGVSFINLDFPFEFKIDGNTIIDGVRYDTQIRENFSKENISSAYGVNTVRVDNTMGQVKILPSDGSSIKIEAVVSVKCNDEAKAKEYAKEAIVISEGTTTEISTKNPTDAQKKDFARAMIDYVIYVPKTAKVEIDEKFGNVQVEGINANVEVDNKYGETKIYDIDGDVTLNSSFGSIELEDISGKTVVDNKNGKITAKNISTAELETSFGSIEAEDINGDLTANSKNGKVSAKNVSGRTELESSFGSIKAEDIEGNLVARSNNGSIEAYNIKGDAKLKTSFGSIKIESDSLDNCTLTAETSMGSIDTDRAFNVKKSGSRVTAEGKTGNGQYSIELETSNGSIEIR